MPRLPASAGPQSESSSGLESALERIAARTGRPLPQVRREAERAFAEMRCRRSRWAIALFATLSRFVRKRGYHPQVICDLAEVERLRRQGRGHSIVYLATHKTYLDFFVLFDFLHQQGLDTPYIFGGINMDFAGFGGLARRAGGIFIRRHFGDDPVYKAVLQAYLRELVAGGATFMWAIEGTRSRTGKLLMPRLGLLNYVVRAGRAIGAEAIRYVPVSVVYDQIPDVIDMAAQEAGAAKRPESLGWFVEYLRGLGGPFGNIYLRFGEAMRPDDTPDAPDLGADGPPAARRRIETQKLAFEVCYRINEITPATMTSLVMLSLLCRRRCDADRIARDVGILDAYIRRTDRRVALQRPSRPLPAGPAESIDALLANGVVRRADGALEIDPARLSEAIYYSNMAVHHFVVSAFVETALALCDAPLEILPECRRLRNLFKFEFFFSRSEVFARQVARELDELGAEPEPLSRGGNPAALALLRRKPLLVAEGILQPFVHAYRMVAERMQPRRDGRAPSADEVIADCLAADRTAPGEDADGPRVRVSRALLQNGLRLAESRGLGSGDARRARSRRAGLLAELARTERALSCLRRLAQQP